MVRAFPALLLVASVSCGADADMAAPTAAESCPGNETSVSFSVTPAVVGRGEAVNIAVVWLVRTPLVPPVVATLRAGSGMVVEAELPLSKDPGADPIGYAGELTNPFGLGAPAGTLEVLATSAPPSGCRLAPTAATAITLE